MSNKHDLLVLLASFMPETTMFQFITGTESNPFNLAHLDVHGFGVMLAQVSPALCSLPCLHVSAMGLSENADPAGSSPHLFRTARRLRAEKALSTVYQMSYA